MDGVEGGAKKVGDREVCKKEEAEGNKRTIIE